MEDPDFAAIEIGQHSGDELLANLDPVEVEGIRQSVLRAVAEVERGEFTEYKGREGLEELCEDIKARGRQWLLATENEKR